MTGSIKDYTPNFEFIIPEFNITGWHDYLEENFRSIDALFYNLFGINNYKGQWKNSTVYNVDDVVFVGEDTDYSGRLIKVLIQHTTAGTGNFTEFFTANPSYYELFADASTAQIYAQEAKDWAVKMDGPVEEDLYSSKFYANIVNGLSTEITTLYNIRSDIQNVSLIGTEVVNVSNIKNSVQSVANNSTNINTVANNITDVNTTATNIASVNTNASNISAINTNASNISDIQNAHSNAHSALISKNLAQEWATSENLIDGTDYSAKHYAEIASQHENPLRIGQIIQSTIPLNDAGLHLLDGSVISGNGIYLDFVDYMVQNSKKFNPTPFTFSGGASVNSNGITTALSISRRCGISVSNITPTNKIVFNFSGILNTLSLHYFGMESLNIVHTGVIDRNLDIKYSNNTLLSITNEEISTYNSNFTDIKIELTTTKIKATVKNNGNIFTKEANINISFETITGIRFPDSGAGSFIANLKNCSLSIDDIEIFSGSTQQDYFTDETSWQNSVNTYGTCGKFVYDNINNTIRLPKITGFIEGTIDPTALGVLIEAGCPNIIGDVGRIKGHDIYNTGAFYTHDHDTVTNLNCINAVENDGYGNRLGIDASLSSTIYGNSNTVQPQSIKILYYVCIATSIKTDIEVDIDEIATDLNEKADKDLSNINPNQTIKENIISWGMPDYNAGVTKTANTEYTADTNGWIFGYNDASGNSNPTLLYIDGNTIQNLGGNFAGQYTENTWQFPITKGTTYKISTGTITWYPVKGEQS